MKYAHIKVEYFVVGIAFMMFGQFTPAYAQTIIPSGAILEDTTWDKSGSPYIITDNLWIDTGVTLTIKPGVVVKFDDGILIVGGNLIAEGTPDEKIYFTSFRDDTVGGDTNGDGDESSPGIINEWEIGFYNTKPSVFSYVVMDYMTEGMFIGEANVEIKNSEIKNLGQEIFVWASQLELENVTVDEVSDRFLGVFSGGQANIINSSISNLSGSLGIGVYDSSLFLSDVTMSGFLGDAINVYESLFKINDSIISDGLGNGITIFNSIGDVILDKIQILDFYEVGLGFFNSTAQVKQSKISGNSLGVQTYESELDFKNNSVSGNSFGFFGIPTTEVNATENWWGDPSGPYHLTKNQEAIGDEVSDRIIFSPWLITDPLVEPQGFSNVLFLPGLKASRLYKDGLIGENTLWEPNGNKDIEALFLNSDGASIDSEIYTSDVVDEIYGSLGNIYKTFIGQMDDLVAEGVIKEWKAFPYDWRLDLVDIVNGKTKLADGETINLIEEVQRLAQSSDSGQVTIISHSNGGLVGKFLISELEKRGKSNLIDKFIMVGSPQLGTPEAIGGLLHADGEGKFLGLITKQETARQLAENMPSGYNLLPTSELASILEENFIVFEEGESTEIYRNTYGDTIDNVDELSQFLLGEEGRSKPEVDDLLTPNVLNKDIFDQSENVRNFLDDWQAPSGVRMVQIIGWGIDTIKGFKYQDKEVRDCTLLIFACKTKNILDHRPLLTVDGDGTVLSPSAGADGGEKYYLNLRSYNTTFSEDRKHSDILEAGSVLNFLKNLVINKDDIPEFIEDVQPVAEDVEDRLQISVHSPVSIMAESSSGLTTGKVLRTDPTVVTQDIPNSYYLEVGEGKYLGLPSNEDYELELVGLDNGTFTLEIAEAGSDAGEVLIYQDIPVLASSTARVLVTDDGEVGPLEVDLDNDGSSDVIYEAGGDNSSQKLETLRYFIGEMEGNRGIKRAIERRIKILERLAERRNKKPYLNEFRNLRRFILTQAIKHFKDRDAKILLNLLN